MISQKKICHDAKTLLELNQGGKFSERMCNLPLVESLPSIKIKRSAIFVGNVAAFAKEIQENYYIVTKEKAPTGSLLEVSF